MPEIGKPQDTQKPISQAVVEKVVQDNARTVADAAARRTAEATQQGSRTTGEALGAEAGAAAMRRAGEAASETARLGGRAVVESQRQIVQDAAERFVEVSGKMAAATRGTSENMRRLMTLPNAAEGGLRELQQGMVGLFVGAVRTNLRFAQELVRLANPAPIMELQQRFAREYTDTMLRNRAMMFGGMRRTGH